MKIFDKRPLSLVLCIMLGAFVLFSFYSRLLPRIILISLGLATLIITFIPAIRKRLSSVVIIRVASVCAFLAILFSFLYFDLWFKAYDRYDGDVTVVGTVQNITPNSYTNALYVKTDNINGTPLSEYDLIVYVDKNLYYGFSVGSKIKFNGTIEAFTNEKDFDAESYYTSLGISGVINEVKVFEIIDNGKYPFSYLVSDFRGTICRNIIYNSNKDVGGLLCALLLGEKQYLPTGTKLDFSRIGISHILALSGMHLAILAVGFSKLLRFFKVGKKTSTLFTVIFTVFYMALTGFSVSVTRAGLMLIVSSILFLLSRTHDSITSLFVAVFIICIIEPYSIFDISLWLSAFATFGIVVMSEYNSTKYEKASFLRWITTSFLSSFFAISATFAITITKFNGTSLLAAISTIIFSLLTELFIYVGLLLIFLGNLIPIKYIFIPIGNLIIDFASYLSRINWIYVSTDFTIIAILSVIFSVLFFSFFVLEVKRKKVAITALAALLLTIFSVSAFLTYEKQNDTSIIYNSTDTESFLISNDGKICVIDICAYKTSTSYSTYNAVVNNCLTKIDKYVLTHYSYYLEESLDTLIEKILIKEIYMPMPQSKTEERILFDIQELTDSCGISLNVYEKEVAISIGEISVFPLYNYKLDDKKKNMLTILYNDNFYTYLNVDMLEGETKNMALEVIAGSHTIIFGHHESTRTEYILTYEFEEINTLIFSSTRIILNNDIEYYSNKNTYFLPTKVSLIR